MKKTAWTWSDVAGELGISAIVDIGLMGALGAAGVFSGGATGAAGAAAAIGVTNPIGWILLAGGVAYAIYEGTKQLDDNIKDLISRIEALDYENTRSEKAVNKWLIDLQQWKGIFDVEIPLEDKDQEAQRLAEKVKAFVQLKNYLDKMIIANWPKVKEYLTDWGTDPSDFEYALRTTYSNLIKTLKEVQAESKKAGAEWLKENPQTINPLMTEILSLTSQIKNTWGAPEFTNEERQTFELGRQMLKKQEMDINTIRDTIGKLNILRNDLKKLLQEAKRRRQKRGEAILEIEKQAVELPEKPTVNVSGPKSSTPQQTIQRRLLKNPKVKELQILINRVAVAKGLNIAVQPDAVYGPLTGKALASLLSADETLKSQFRRWGFTPQTAMDVRFVNKYPKFIVMAVRMLMASLVEKPTTPTQQAPVQTAIQCNWKKHNPSPQEILACLQTLYAYKGGSRVALYDYMRTLGMDDDNMVRYVLSQTRGDAPISWSPDTLMRNLGSRYGPF